MPSTVSSSVWRPFASSTVITPSLPTFSIASAIRSPISRSLFAEMEPTWAISFLPLVGTDIFLSSSMTISTALSMPRFSAIGLAPAVTFFRPSRKTACASTVFVVDLDLSAAVFPVQHAVAHLDLERHALALLEAPRSHGDDLALLRLLLRRIRDVQPAPHRLRVLEWTNRDAIGERVHLHLGL